MTTTRRRRRGGRPRRGGEPEANGSGSGAERASGASRPAALQARIPELCELSPFSAFCALYLGITERNGYARQDREAVARRFSLSLEELDLFLREHALERDSLSRAGFDAESARLDIEVAPEGISRLELARTLFEELPKPEETEPV
jgi:hypothetical protein